MKSEPLHTLILHTALNTTDLKGGTKGIDVKQHRSLIILVQLVFTCSLSTLKAVTPCGIYVES